MRHRASTLRIMVGLSVITLCAAACSGAPETLENEPTDPGSRTPDRWTVEVVAVTPHDRAAFTQGLEFAGTALIESTGRYGESTIRMVDPVSGAVANQVRLDDDLFGEGATVVGDRIIQLTWREGRALVWDTGDLSVVGEFAYAGEGWGLCWTGEDLAMSDGSSTLQFRDPADFRLLRTLDVTANGAAVTLLNELECTRGRILANVWQTDTVVMIDPATGEVTAEIDLSPLRSELSPAESEGIDHLNGVAAVPGGDTYLVTGKLWPEMYEVRLVPAAAGS